MSIHNSIWITVFSSGQDNQWRVIENIRSYFRDCDYIFCAFKEHDYDQNDDMEFLSHVLHLINLLLDVKHTFCQPIVVCDISVDYIKKRMENFKCKFIGLNIDELLSNRRISTNMRHNKFLFFTSFEAKKKYEELGLSTINSCTTANVEACIDEAKRYIQAVLDGDIRPRRYLEAAEYMLPANS